MSEEEQLSRRLHGLVALPPAGRNLVPAIHRAASRRRTRYLAVGSGVGVTTVVLGGAGLVGAFNANRDSAPPLVGATPTRSVAVVSPIPVSPVAVPLRLGLPSAPAAADGSASAPSLLPSATVSAMAPAPKGVLNSSAPDTQNPATANFVYSRTANEQYGIRTVVGRWFSRTGAGSAPATGVAPLKPGEPPSLVQFKYTTHYTDEVPWVAFSVVPAAEQLHRWMFGSPHQAKTLYGYDLTGTPRGNEYAFEEGLELINGTPSTPAFRLAVLEALKRVPGVVVRASAADSVGRKGIELSLHSAPNVGIATSTLRDIIEPTDGALLQGEITDDSRCPAGSLIWRAVYLESGIVPDEQMVLPETVPPPSGPPANCVQAGEQLPPGASATSRVAAK